MTGRRRARELVLKAQYAYHTHPRDVVEIFDELMVEAKLEDKYLEFARNLYDIIIKNAESLDDQIKELASNWELERIATIDRIILRIALAEINFMPDIPEKVAINEAIELAKLYSTNESGSFVNGILDAAIVNPDRARKK